MTEHGGTDGTGTEPEAFSLSDVPIYTGVSRPRLEDWIRRGWVRPSLNPGQDRSQAPYFSRVDLYHIAFLRKVKESGFSRDLAVEKINVYAICRASGSASPTETVGIAFSREEEGDRRRQGAWIISETLDRETGWDSLNLVGERLREGADDFYILNFTRLARRIDRLVQQAAGRQAPRRPGER